MQLSDSIRYNSPKKAVTKIKVHPQQQLLNI